MSDFYNDDLTQDERPVLSDAVRAAHGSLATDDSGIFRITNPLTGAGLFTSNMNPLVSGLDPLTGGTALAGTDILFGASVRRYLSSRVVNGAMEEPPPDINSPISEDNPLPGWRWVQASGTSLIPRWVSVGAGALNGQVNVEMTAGAAGDLAYLEQLVPVNPSQGAIWYYRVLPFVNGSTSKLDAYVTAQFIDATGATTGSAASDTGDDTATAPLYPDTDGTSSGIAAWLRIRVGFQRNSGAATTATATGVITEVAVNESNEYGIYDKRSGNWTPELTAATPGDLSVAYSAQLGQYRRINDQVFLNFKIVTSTWTHSTASGLLKITGLPFTPATQSGQHWTGGGTIRFTKANFHAPAPIISSADPTIYWYVTGSGQAPTLLVVSETPSGTQVTAQGQLWYHV